jgi:lactoylglutathione lyase
MISDVKKVVVPVDDQQRAKEFWTERVGFAVARDEAYGEERWIEVGAPDGSVVLVLSPRQAADPRREVPDGQPDSPVFFTCEDLQRTHRELSGRGVSFPTPPTQMHFGWWAMFEDLEGTRFALGEF